MSQPLFNAGRGLAIALLLAIMAHGVIRGAGTYKMLLLLLWLLILLLLWLWLYVIAPVVDGVL